MHFNATMSPRLPAGEGRPRGGQLVGRTYRLKRDRLAAVVNEKLTVVGRKFQIHPPAAATAVLIASGFLALTNPAKAADRASPDEGAPVNVVKSVNECFSALVRVPGFLVPRTMAAVGIDADGSRITEVLVSEGDIVAAGQVMARFARPTYDGAPQGGPGVPPGAGVPGGAPPSAGVLRAPYAGRVMQSTANVGSTASLMGEPLFQLAVDNELEIEVEVPSVHVPSLAAGQTARVEIEGGRELPGQVRLVLVEINPRTQMGRARISVAADPSLRTGKFVRATIVARRSCGIAVPRAAISYWGEGTTVQVVRDGIVETRDVQIGLRSDVNAEILRGVAEGDLLVANAGTSLRNGDRVRPVFRTKSD
jgi:HlyD family secretion protein